ncbi:MAG: heterodisulfide reductase-related iron-sulfur binding cluster [Desulfobacterota bacterium]|jgi:Fe-S oxidoreductase|nr:heterodisulfide reductase-related iron-sulfur binding cluster [Thermodesulfobacteriota bacterium]
MQPLVFDPEICLACESVDCIMRCQYIDLDQARAKQEHDRIVRGEMSSILKDCVTCYACEEYCPSGNHPFYHIVEQQERLGVHPVPRPIEKSQVIMMAPRGRIGKKLVSPPVIDMCFFDIMKGGIRGRLFDGATTIGGSDVFCNLMFLHFARNSTIRERLPLVMDNIMRFHLEPSGVRELICYHDECYGTYTSWAPAFGIEVPFRPVHLFDYLYHRLLELKADIKPLNAKVAYQRPCSNRLCPETDHFVDDIFGLIGAQRPKRTYEYGNALCCGGVPEAAQRFDLVEEIRGKNVADMKEAGVQYCVFNCPFCFWTLAEPVAKAGIFPVMMSDLCLMALGE